MWGVGSQSLTGGSPRRLLQEAGKWVLEVVRHVDLGQDLIRPTTQRLSGNRVITSYFNSNPDKALLAKATQKLLQTDAGGTARSYTAVGGEWIVNSIPPGPSRPDSERPLASEPTLLSQLDELKSQLVLLTAVQEGLLARLARLEAKIGQPGTQLAQDEAEPERGRPARRGGGSAPNAAPTDEGRPAARDALRPAQQGSASAGASQPPGAATAEAAQVEEASSAVASQPPPAAPAPPARVPSSRAAAIPKAAAAAPGARPELTLPPASELARCISLLLGGEVSATEAPPMPVTRVTKDCHAASIVDDAGQTLAIIVMDLKATVFLGGTLMMLPKTELEQQFKAQSPGEDSIAASAEICNALSGAINGAQDIHVRAGGLEKFEFRTCSWVTNPAERRDLEDSFGGHIVVLSRRVDQPPIG
jgi:hypothetical protein